MGKTAKSILELPTLFLQIICKFEMILISKFYLKYILKSNGFGKNESLFVLKIKNTHVLFPHEFLYLIFSLLPPGRLLPLFTHRLY